MSPLLPRVAVIVLASFGLPLILERVVLSQSTHALTTTAPLRTDTFSPSNARTEDGKLIPAEEFFPAARCATCHHDTHSAWSESLHRNAGREPFYKESVNILQRTRGNPASQHCESCHSPIAVFSGALLKGGRDTRTEDEGVSCAVCHSITEARVDGTGSYTIRRPALLVHEDGTPVFGDLPDSAILADIPGHRRAMMRPLLKTSEFCATCHKSTATPQLNNYKFLRGFSTYDEWQQSGASFLTVTPYYRRERQFTCSACHMPKIESANDLAAKNGLISSHRWLGANTAAPLFYGQMKQVELTENFLRDNVLSVDIFALRNQATSEIIAPLAQREENQVALQPGEEVIADVVVFNRKAAHTFPPELRDMYEPWVEFEVVDSSGQTVFHSGFIKPDRTLDESAHVYKQILLDEAGRPLTRHQVWLGKIKAYDNFVPPGRSDLARFRFRVPKDAVTSAFGSMTLRARVNYRRFIQEYTDFVLEKYNSHIAIPVVNMAEAEVKLVGRSDAETAARGDTVPAKGSSQAEDLALARRWNDYGIAQLEQAQFGLASDAFRHASELNPSDPDPVISCAIAEFRTERYGPEHDQLRKTEALLDRALKINPTLPRAHFYHALVLRAEGKAQDAANELGEIVREYPRDREVQRQLGQTLYSLGRMAEARAAFEAVLMIDPTDAGAYQFLSPIYKSEGRQSDAARTQSLYLLWRDDPLTDPIAARFFVAHPEWADERISAHIHGDGSPPRPTLTGRFAAPEK